MSTPKSSFFGTLALVSVIAVTSGALSGCSSSLEQAELVTEVSPDPGASPGQLVWLPQHPLTINVGKPVQEPPEIAASDRRKHYSGATFVPIDLAYVGRPDTAQPSALAGAWEGAPAPQVRFTSDAGEVDLSKSIGSSVYVAVPDKAAGDYAIEIVYDGVTQKLTPDGTLTSDGPGQLADVVQTESACGDGWTVVGRPQAISTIACSVSTATVPYLPGHGWAFASPAAGQSPHADTRWHVLNVSAVAQTLDLAPDQMNDSLCTGSARGSLRNPELSVEADGAPELISVPDKTGSTLVAYASTDRHTWPATRLKLSGDCLTGDGPRHVTLTRTLDFTR